MRGLIVFFVAAAAGSFAAAEILSAETTADSAAVAEILSADSALQTSSMDFAAAGIAAETSSNEIEATGIALIQFRGDAAAKEDEKSEKRKIAQADKKAANNNREEAQNSATYNNKERSKIYNRTQINNRTQDVAGAEDSVAQRRREGLALYREAMALESGNDTVAADTVAALGLYRRAAEAGLAEAQNYLGWCLYNGIGTDADERQGVEWIERAARQGDVKACNNLGWLLSRGREVVRDYRKALYWFGKAAEAGLPQAQCQAADMFRLGLGTEADTVRARKLYRAAFAGGLRDAELKLLAMDYPSFLLLSGVQAVALGEEYAACGMHSVAVTLFELAAEKGEAEAFFMLGQAAALGRGVAYDYERALELYYKAALLGSRRAQRVVGETLEVFPDAFPSDRFGAEYWLEKCR